MRTLNFIRLHVREVISEVILMLILVFTFLNDPIHNSDTAHRASESVKPRVKQQHFQGFLWITRWTAKQQ